MVQKGGKLLTNGGGETAKWVRRFGPEIKKENQV